MHTLPKRFAEKVDFDGDCWLWRAYKTRGGYGHYRSEGNMVRAHRFSWEHFKGKIPKGLHVLHRCDNPSCVNPDHLFLGTHMENMNDMVRKGRSANGERNGKCKLTQLDVAEIQRLYKAGKAGTSNKLSQRGLAKKFGVGQHQISRIVNRKSRV